MFHTEHDDILQKRQDRTIAFFDAILAIAITIMALSITFPGLSDVLDKGLDSNFINHLTGYLISFLTLGVLWYMHMLHFTYNEFVGKSTEIILHFVLLFFITLFQPITTSLITHRGDRLNQLAYLIVSFLMYVVNLALIGWSRRENEKKNQKNKELWKLYHDYVLHDPEEKNPQAMEIARYVSQMQKPEILLAKRFERLPAEYQDIIQDHKEERQLTYRYTVVMTWVFIVIVNIAVAMFPYSIIGTYLVLLFGLLVLVMSRFLFYHKKREIIDDEETE